MAQIYDGFSASVIYGLESYGFCKEGEALDFIQDGRIELDGELPLNTFGGSLGTGRIHGLWHIIEGALQASGRAGSRQVKDANVSFVGRERADRDGDDVYLREGAVLSGIAKSSCAATALNRRSLVHSIAPGVSRTAASRWTST